MRSSSGRVEFPCDRETAFDYLVDPRNRPEWQSSLRGVSEVDGEPRIGQTWVDQTRPGLRPRMRTTELVRPSRWAESGTWRVIRAELSLDLVDSPAGCTASYRFRIHALGPLGLAVSHLAAPVVRADLRRAARILSSR